MKNCAEGVEESLIQSLGGGRWGVEGAGLMVAWEPPPPPTWCRLVKWNSAEDDDKEL